MQTDTAEVFSAVGRVYGQSGLERLRSAHVCVAGIGGVGSWAVEALARTGVGKITLIDHDDVSISNINRQVHSDAATIDRSKVEVMAERVALIDSACECHAIDDMLVTKNIEKYIGSQFDYVIDAIDSVSFKAALINFCKRNKIPVIMTGGAGGRTDPSKIAIIDLSKTWNDALAANVRKRLRNTYGWNKKIGKRLGVDCVFSSQQPLYPQADGTIGQQKTSVAGATLDCNSGYGSVVSVTAIFGFMAAAHVMNTLAGNPLKRRD